MKKIILVVAGIMFLLVIAVVLWASPPRFIQEWGLPEIARNLPSNFRDGYNEFNNRVQKNYEIGTKETDLVSWLLKEGFTIDLKNRSAKISRNNFPCQLAWRIHWETGENNLITQIHGVYGSACL